MVAVEDTVEVYTIWISLWPHLEAYSMLSLD